MKKIILVSIITALIITSLVSCSNNDANSNEQPLMSLYDTFDTWFSSEINKNLTEEDAKEIKQGMRLDETVNLIGRPQRDVGSGTHVLEWDLKSGKVINIGFVLDFSLLHEYGYVEKDGILYKPAGSWLVNVVEVKDKPTVLK